MRHSHHPPNNTAKKRTCPRASSVRRCWKSSNPQRDDGRQSMRQTRRSRRTNPLDQNPRRNWRHRSERSWCQRRTKKRFSGAMVGTAAQGQGLGAAASQREELEGREVHQINTVVELERSHTAVSVLAAGGIRPDRGYPSGPGRKRRNRSKAHVASPLGLRLLLRDRRSHPGVEILRGC